MIKYTVLFFAFVASIAVTSALKPEDIIALRAEALPHIHTCSKEFGISTADLVAAEEKQDADSLNPCFYSCFLKKAGLVNEAGLFDIEATQKRNQEFFKNKEARDSVSNIINKCASVNDQAVENVCDTAKLLFICISKEKPSN